LGHQSTIVGFAFHTHFFCLQGFAFQNETALENFAHPLRSFSIAPGGSAAAKTHSRIA
jgi:hypothetical protein